MSMSNVSIPTTWVTVFRPCLVLTLSVIGCSAPFLSIYQHHPISYKTSGPDFEKGTREKGALTVCSP